MSITTLLTPAPRRRRRRDWSAHDAAVTFREPRLVRPQRWIEPTASDSETEARPMRGRRLSWQAFYAMRPDLRPANDNEKRPGLEPGQYEG